MITKNSTIEEKVAWLKTILQMKEDVVPSDVEVLNVLNLIGNGNLTDELFSNQDIVFKDLAEYSDIKTALKPEITTLKQELAHNYLAVISSCRVLRAIRPESIIKLHPLIKLLLLNLGFFQLNTILANNIKKVDVTNLPIVDDGIAIMQTIVKSMQMLDVFINELKVDNGNK